MAEDIEYAIRCDRCGDSLREEDGSLASRPTRVGIGALALKHGWMGHQGPLPHEGELEHRCPKCKPKS